MVLGGKLLFSAILVAGGSLVAGCGGAAGPTPTTPAPSATASASATPAVPSPAATTPQARPPATSTVNVWFLDREHAQTGEEPLFRPVRRQVQLPALAARALDALFTGPTAAERADRLELITSGATGYSRLHIQDGIAYVTLEGGCSSGGSTMTVAGEIMPTLRQFASVSYVKIYAPDGSTEHPSGATDSIPACLEP